MCVGRRAPHHPFPLLFRAKIFLRYTAFQYLENLRRKKHEEVTIRIQSFVRRFLVRRRRAAVIKIQRWYRMLGPRQRFCGAQRIARFVQRRIRAKRARVAAIAAKEARERERAEQQQQKKREREQHNEARKRDAATAAVSADLRILVAKGSDDKDAIEMKMLSSSNDEEDNDTTRRLLEMEHEMELMKKKLKKDDDTVDEVGEAERQRTAKNSAALDPDVASDSCCFPWLRKK